MSEVEQFSPYKRKGYSQTEQTQIRKAFRRKHGCCNCLNEWDFDSCMEMGICRYDPNHSYATPITEWADSYNTPISFL